jgi:hypothetical protein
LLAIVPPPVPLLATVSVNALNVNVAVTDLAAFIATVQEVPVALSQPDQLMKSESAPGAAVRVTDVLIAYAAEQVAPQLIPAGLLVRRPLPVPAFVTARANVLRAKEAVTFFATSIVTVHDPVPVHAPDQPAKLESALGAAVRVTWVLIS